MQRCPNCRRPVNPGDTVCDFCEQQIDSEQNAQATTHKQNTRQSSDQTQRPNQQGRNRARSPQTGNNREQVTPDSQESDRLERNSDNSTQSSYRNHTNSRGAQQSNHNAQQGQSHSSEPQTGAEQTTQNNFTQQKSAPSTKSDTFNTTNSTSTGKVNVNNAAWWIGWRPLPVILIAMGVFLIVGFIIGSGIEITAGLAIVGAVLGTGVYYWGTTEINSKYVEIRNNFFERSRGRAEDKSGLTVSDYNESYSLRVRVGNSPPFVKSSKSYKATYGFLTDVSFDLDKGNIYNMKSRTEGQRGKQRQVFYDNMEDIKIDDRGGTTEVVILTSAGGDISLESGDQQQAEALQRDLRKKLREIKRQATGHRSV